MVHIATRDAETVQNQIKAFVMHANMGIDLMSITDVFFANMNPA